MSNISDGGGERDGYNGPDDTLACLESQLDSLGLSVPPSDTDTADNGSDGLDAWARALLDRLSSPRSVELSGGATVRSVRDDALRAALSVERDRDNALRKFWGERMLPLPQPREPAHCTVDTVRITDRDEAKESEGRANDNDNGGDDDDDEREEGDDILAMTALEFKRRFVHRNVPCIVRGLDRTGFRRVTHLWRTAGVDREDGRCRINDDWFLDHVGEDTAVPVRVSPRGDVEGSLDDEGRATECETAEMPLRCWVELCRGKGGTATPDPSMYLKDWHLMQQLERNRGTTNTGEDGSESETRTSERAGDRNAVDDAPLYSVPSIFAVDVLNRFLLRHVGGDYRFVYWGPAGSITTLHSDVLHTFSWSYNVVGEKLWTFYPPVPSPPMDQGGTMAPLQGTSRPSSFVLTQRDGEAVFVPSGWKHKVTNRRETLSINHNWATAASVDRVWDCIAVEMSAVEREADSWGIPADDWAAREDMLRGCVGLNITSFFFMLLTSLVDQIIVLDNGWCGEVPSDAMLWESFFNMFRLCQQLNDITEEVSQKETDERPTHKWAEADRVKLRERLCATSKSESSANKALLIASRITGAVDALRHC